MVGPTQLNQPGQQPAVYPAQPPFTQQPPAQQPPPTQQLGPQPGWQRQPWGPQRDSAVDTPGTPWANADLPPKSNSDIPWPHQGPEVFAVTEKSGRGKLYAGLFLGGLLLAAALAAVVLYFAPFSGTTGQAEEPPPPPQPPTTPSSTVTEPPSPEAAPPPKPPPADSRSALVTAPGAAHPWNGPLDRRALANDKRELLPRPVRDFALRNNLEGGWFNGNDGRDSRVSLLALRMPNESAAKDVLERHFAAHSGSSTVDEMAYGGVAVISDGATYRTAYVTHDWAVLVAVGGPPEMQRDTGRTFERILGDQLRQSPPTVRE